MIFKYINNETNEIMTRDEAIDWLKENIGIKFEFTLDSKKLKRQSETEEVLLEAYFYQEKEEPRQLCKWCEEQDELYERHKEDYLFD